MNEQFASVFHHASTALLIVDKDLRVAFVNKASLEMLKKYEREIRKVYPRFRVAATSGLALTDVGVIPGDIITWFRDPKRKNKAKFVKIGAETFHVSLYSLRDADGNDLGTGVEWWYATEYLNSQTNNQRIVDIVTVIDGLTMQSNMLSLNAAVEAARLGQHGRGFAVIAAEMRALAQKSRDAARAIKENLNRVH